MNSGSVIQCPHCQGMGLKIYEDHVGPCELSGVNGYIELPVTPSQADVIYRDADAPETENLVCQMWDREGDDDLRCFACVGREQCRECYREQGEAEEREYVARVMGRKASRDDEEWSW